MGGAISATSIAISRRYISRPLLRLEQSAASIASGDLDAAIDRGRDAYERRTAGTPVATDEDVSEAPA